MSGEFKLRKDDHGDAIGCDNCGAEAKTIYYNDGSEYMCIYCYNLLKKGDSESRNLAMCMNLLETALFSQIPQCRAPHPRSNQ